MSENGIYFRAILWVSDVQTDVVVNYLIDGGGLYSPQQIGVPGDAGKLSHWLIDGWLIESASGWGPRGSVIVVRANPGGWPKNPKGRAPPT